MRLQNGLIELRLEQALRLLPDVEGLGTLRARLYALAHENVDVRRHDTVAKRSVSVELLREAAVKAAADDGERAVRLCAAAAEAIAFHQRGDRLAATRALLSAGESEERDDRLEQAAAWYQHAARSARDLRDRMPEIEATLHMGLLDAERGRWADAERDLGRSLVLADAEGDHPAALRASRALGELELARGDWREAEMWCRRGIARVATASPHRGALLVGLARAALEAGKLQDAESFLRDVPRIYRDLPETEIAEGATAALLAWSALDRARGDPRLALERLREARERLERAGGCPSLEVEVHASASEILATEGRFHEAEVRARDAERAALRSGRRRILARAYVALGRIRRFERDETGFTFFESALELLRGADPAPHVEAEVYLEYGWFHRALENASEAATYWTQAREIWGALGASARAAEVEALLADIAVSSEGNGTAPRG